MRLVAVGSGSSQTLRGELHQVDIARLVLGEQHDRRARQALRRRAASAVAGASPKSTVICTPMIGCTPAFGELFGKLERAEEIVGVGDRQRRHRVGLGELGERLDPQRPLAQRIGAVDVQMHEADGLENRGGHGA